MIGNILGKFEKIYGADVFQGNDLKNEKSKLIICYSRRNAEFLSRSEYENKKNNFKQLLYSTNTSRT